MKNIYRENCLKRRGLVQFNGGSLVRRRDLCF